MTYRVELSARAIRDLRQLYQAIAARHVPAAATWFNGLEAKLANLARLPRRGGVVPEDGRLRQLLYGRRPHVYRIIYQIDEGNRIVSVLHIRHGARDVMAGED
ncbi:putative Plasmid stabilization system [Magnetospirillum sp. XM-1]|uniref:type II toxin-antitoxin system RelE/ParE family toxin n=1 Tax=Magnetospirillum sp. XM-1 TaxID=1663591 RepID=UPI00073DFBD7|nr:type II toxin-antitoxin system RelE/ParE family toxin [Magnetospirillum sp. XM-1]CUW39234.1 putative Plasmid stabilization system [Magnetospirillum sp. XM-1]